MVSKIYSSLGTSRRLSLLCGSYTGGYPLFSKISFEKFNTFAKIGGETVSSTKCTRGPFWTVAFPLAPVLVLCEG